MSALSLISVAVIKDSDNKQLREERVYLPYTSRPQTVIGATQAIRDTRVRTQRMNLRVGWFAIPPSVTFNQEIHSQSRKYSRNHRGCCLLAITQAYPSNHG